MSLKFLTDLWGSQPAEAKVSAADAERAVSEVAAVVPAGAGATGAAASTTASAAGEAAGPAAGSFDWSKVDRMERDAAVQNLELLQRLAQDPKAVFGFGINDKARTVQFGPLTIMESCVFKAALAGTAGAAFGGFLGLFLGSHSTVSYDPALERLSTADQMKVQLRQMRKATWSSARNMAAFGVVYSSIECAIEKKRAVGDMRNAVYAGAITGGLFALKGGPVASVMGAGGMALFSAAIEYYQRHYFGK